MNTLEKVQRQIRSMKLRFMLGSGDLSADRAAQIADTVTGWARSDLAAGARKDLVLFSFESSFEEISDEIAKLADRGEAEAYRDIYEKIYEFACETMEDAYMPLYLFILYRYANALLMTGETGKAVRCFEKLLEGTERLIGIENLSGMLMEPEISPYCVRHPSTVVALEVLLPLQE